MTPYELRILGAPDLRASDGRRVTSVLSQPSRLSLLAYLTLASGPVTRASVVATFWPERDEARARNALSQAVFYLRRSLGKDAVQSVEGDRLWVPPESVWCDARELLTDVQPSDDIVAAADHDLLAGWNAEGSQPLQEWLDTQRRRIRDRQLELREARSASDPPASPPSGPGIPTTAATDPAATPTPRQHRSIWVPAVVTFGIAAVLLIATFRDVAPGPEASSDSARVLVLVPRVASSPGVPQLAPLTLNDQLLARLPEREALDVLSAPSASSLQEFVRQREFIIEAPGADADPPEWILDVGVVVTGNAANVVVLIYHGSSFLLEERGAFVQTFQTSEEIVFEVPRAIAERVAEMVAEAIGR